jgi:hypothetical protein
MAYKTPHCTCHPDDKRKVLTFPKHAEGCYEAEFPLIVPEYVTMFACTNCRGMHRHLSGVWTCHKLPAGTDPLRGYHYVQATYERGDK